MPQIMMSEPFRLFAPCQAESLQDQTLQQRPKKFPPKKFPPKETFLNNSPKEIP